MTITTKELEAKLGRKVSVNEWRIANGMAPIKKIGRKTRKPAALKQIMLAFRDLQD